MNSRFHLEFKHYSPESATIFHYPPVFSLTVSLTVKPRGNSRTFSYQRYGSRAHHRWLQSLGITDRLARTGWPHGSGLGKTRWVVERTLSWLHQFRRLRIRYERRSDIHQAFLTLSCAINRHGALQISF